VWLLASFRRGMILPTSLPGHAPKRAANTPTISPHACPLCSDTSRADSTRATGRIGSVRAPASGGSRPQAARRQRCITVAGAAPARSKAVIRLRLPCYGAESAIDLKGASKADLEAELQRLTGQIVLDAIPDCVGAPDLMQLGFSLLGTSGHYVDVGLLGDRVDIPLFSRINSNWGNYVDLSEVMTLAAKGRPP
jgi:hypothetical protein